MTAMEALEKMARDLNKDLPPDLWNYVVTISMGKDGCQATATPIRDMYKTKDDVQ